MFLTRMCVRHLSNVKSVWKPIDFKYKDSFKDLSIPDKKTNRYRSRTQIPRDPYKSVAPTKITEDGYEVIQNQLEETRRGHRKSGVAEAWRSNHYTGKYQRKTNSRPFADKTPKRTELTEDGYQIINSPLVETTSYDEDSEVATEKLPYEPSVKSQRILDKYMVNESSFESGPKRSQNNFRDGDSRRWNHNRANRHNEEKNFVSEKRNVNLPDGRYERNNFKMWNKHSAKSYDGDENKNITEDHGNHRKPLQSDNNEKQVKHLKEIGRTHHVYKEKEVPFHGMEGEEDDEILYGMHPVLLATKAQRRTIRKIYYKSMLLKKNLKVKEIVEFAHKNSIECVPVDLSFFKKIFTPDVVHQGIFCIATPIPFEVVTPDNVDQFISPQDSIFKQSPDESIKKLDNRCNDDAETPTTSNHQSLDLNHESAQENADILKTIDTISGHSAGATTTNSTLPKLVNTDEALNKQVNTDAGPIVPEDVLPQTTAPAEEGNQEPVSTDVTSPQPASKQLWVVLDHVMDPMNVGTVLRSCCYFGVSRVLITPNCAEISPVVSKASSGAAEIIPISLLATPVPTLGVLQGKGWRVLTAVTDTNVQHKDTIPVENVTLSSDTILIVGNESTGISRQLCELSDQAVTIAPAGPLASALGCLNVSVATAVLLHSITSSKGGV